MQRFTLTILPTKMVFSLLNKIMSIIWFPTTEPPFTWHALYVLKQSILRKDLKRILQYLNSVLTDVEC